MPQRRGSVIVIVIWAIAVAAIITSSVQLFSQRQATIGREALERVQARWAARAAIEHTLAVMTDHTERPYADDAKAMFRDMYYVSAGETFNASYEIQHQLDGRVFGGPMDEHAKMNINRSENQGMLLVLDDMTLDVMESIGDWMDADDDSSMLGVERDYYLSLEAPYSPRNGALRSLGELELVAGVWPRYFRGEDWNLNNRVDPHEDDGSRAFPPDNLDGVLDAGWSGSLTVYSVSGGATQSGQPRIRLRNADVKELQDRLGLKPNQAQALIEFGKTANNELSNLLISPLGGGPAPGTGGNNNNQNNNQNNNNQNNNNINQNSGGGAQQPGGVEALNDEQLRAIFAETVIEDPLDRKPGKMNLNTVSAEFLRRITSLMGLDEAVADEIIHMRDARPQGILSIADLKSLPNISPQDLQAITRRFDTTSNVFTISARGRSWSSGLEVEIVAVVDRSTVPVRIIEYREQ